MVNYPCHFSKGFFIKDEEQFLSLFFMFELFVQFLHLQAKHIQRCGLLVMTLAFRMEEHGFKSDTRQIDCPKNALSSQIKNFTLGTTFSHSLGQKQYEKLKIEFCYPFFHPAQAVQIFTS